MTPITEVDAIVVGGGVMGCAAALALARRDRRVILLERARIGHAGGSSHGQSRIIRLAYGSTAYIELCRAAYRGWRDIERAADEALKHRTGGLDIAETPLDSWERTRRSMTEAGVAFDLLTPETLRERYPQFNLLPGAMALYQRDTAILHADRCLLALAKLAARRGARIQEGEDVLDIRPDGDHVIVQTDNRRYRAARLVLAPGAAINRLLAKLGMQLPLTVSKEHVALFAAPDQAHLSDLYHVGKLPIFIFHLPGQRFASGFPILRDRGVKMMVEHKEAAANDDTALDHDQLAILQRHARRVLPGLTGEMLEPQTCRYTLTPDEDFVLDRYPGLPQIVLASPCSGHGFKFAPIFGEALADLCDLRPPAIDLRPFSLEHRWSQPERAMPEGASHVGQ